MLFAHIAFAQMPLPSPRPVDGATLFRQQCGVCHTTTLSEPMRQGPPLVGIVGRQAGTFAHFRYSPGFAKTDLTWDEAKLDAWLSNPQELIPGAAMAYRQARPEIRTAIIAYLKELN